MKQSFILAFGVAVALSGCGYYWNQEAGASLDQGEFGTATLTNQAAQICRKVTAANIEKYGAPIGSACPGRLEDGKYAMFSYLETIKSAEAIPSAAVSTNAVESE